MRSDVAADRFGEQVDDVRDEELSPRIILVDPVDTDTPRTTNRTLNRLSALITIIALVTLGVALRPPPPSLTWSMLELPDSAPNLDTLIATPDGFSVSSRPTSGGSRLWFTADADEWTATRLPSAPTRVVAAGDSYVVYDSRSAFHLEKDGSVRSIRLPGLLRTGYGSGRPGIVVGARGIIAHTVMGDVYRIDGLQPVLAITADRWRTATDISPESRCQPPGRVGPDLPPVVSTPGAFFAFVAASDASGVWPICEPIPWTSGDGSVWKRESDISPFGVGAHVADVGWSGGRFVAVGGIGFDHPAVWTSLDGLRWDRVPAPTAADDYVLLEIEGGPVGWVAVGRFTDRPGLTAWVSGQGTCWEALPEEVAGRHVAIGRDGIIIADRSLPHAWVGVPRTLPLPEVCR